MRIMSKIFTNAQWIIVCRIVRALIQLVVGMLSARYLGPTNYGLVDYAAAITAFALPVMQLGMDSVLVQEYLEHPDKNGQIMGTQLVMNLFSALVCMAGVTAFVAVANPGETVTITVCVLYSTSLLFQAVEMLQYWFQAKLLSKYSSMAMLCAYLAVSAYKIYLLVSGKSVYWFALSHAVEYGATGILLLAAYHKVGQQKLHFSWSLMGKLFAKSKHYILAMLMVVVYNRVGSILITQMHGEQENGYYATAVACTCITGFVFTAIIDTARPVVLESRKRSQEAFEKNVSRVYAMTTWLALAQSVGITLFAGLIIRILYGADYLPAVPVLQILIWNSAFSYMGYVRNIWILGEEKHSYLWIINLCGAVVSVVLNLGLIPIWGACGAALASVLVQIFTNFIMGFLLKPIRQNNKLLLQGMNPKLLVELGKNLLENRKETL